MRFYIFFRRVGGRGEVGGSMEGEGRIKIKEKNETTTTGGKKIIIFNGIDLEKKKKFLIKKNF